jgi:membrane fusion protein (multidrug efflux system)
MTIGGPKALVAIAVAGVGAGGLALATGTVGGGGTPATADKFVTAERGPVEVTVGGVGHVTTLSGAAQLSIPGTSSSGASLTGAGAAASGGGSAGSSAGGGSSSASGGGGSATADAVFPTVPGHVTRLLVHTGDRVVAGQPVALLSDNGATAATVVQARSDLSTAQLELAQKSIQDPTRGPPPTNGELLAAEQSVASARTTLRALLRGASAADLAAARADLARAIADRDALLRSDPPPTPTERSAAQAAIDAAAAKLAQLGKGPSRTAVAAATLDLRKARADLAVLRQRGSPAGPIDQALARQKVGVSGQRVSLADLLAGQLTVRAQGSGTVTSVLTTRGASVDPTTPVMRIDDLSHLVVALDLSEFDVAHVQIGSPAKISVDALGGREYEGRVIDVAPSGNSVGGVVNFPVIIALNSGASSGSGIGPLPGMSVSAKIVTAGRSNVLRIPVTAASGGDHPAVQVQGPSGAVSSQPVKLGLEDPQFVEVRSGLRPGQRILVPPGGGA